jgi:hypothetical protein
MRNDGWILLQHEAFGDLCSRRSIDNLISLAYVLHWPRVRLSSM